MAAINDIKMLEAQSSDLNSKSRSPSISGRSSSFSTCPKSSFRQLQTPFDRETKVLDDMHIIHEYDVSHSADSLMPQTYKEKEENLHGFHKGTFIPRAFNTPEEVTQLISDFGVAKSKYSFGKNLLNGMLAGFFVACGGFVSLALAGGVKDGKENPWLPKLLGGATFPIALVLIVTFGGDLFTGNTMVLFVSYLQRRLTFIQLLKNWTIAFWANFIGTVLSALVLGFWAELFDKEPWLSYIEYTAEKKVKMSFLTAFCRGIGANALVCCGIFLGLCSREMAGKFICLWAPVFTFAVAGYEHCIANMFYISLGMFYGADVNMYDFFFKNLFPVTLGNVVGGALIIGVSQYLLYTKHTVSNSILFFLLSKLTHKN